MNKHANYIKKQEEAALIIKKLKAGEQLTQEEVERVCYVLTDPLAEFCDREGTFRLVEILSVEPDQANDLEGEAAEIIRDVIDYSEYIYDDMDSKLKDLLQEKGLM